MLEPWGVQSQDMFGALRSAYFGFSVGGVTLSLSSMIGAAAVFALVLFLTRLVQNWLGSRLLPQTRLDAGRSATRFRTIFGYLGVIVAVLLAGAQIGLDVQKLALIAGGLSVGIGFGLQTIANNFVSGLILLVGAHDPRRRLGGGGSRSGLRPRDQRPRDRDRDLRSRHA